MRNILTLIFTILVLTGCEKQNVLDNCMNLQKAIAANDIPKVNAEVTRYIKQLPSDQYNEQNLQELAKAIGLECGINATLSCFDCIYTLPSQSEIRISFTSGSTSINKTIDISYNVSDNKMKFVNIHD